MNVKMTSLALLAATLGTGSLPAAAQSDGPTVAVVVNGTPVTFDQPPVERAGRVFVPLRGVFEQLGASVVYANGQINATSGRHTISLSLGSTNATVDGRPAVIDSPPFLIGARTLVPLRFISQALGATVTFDGARETVFVSLAAPGPRRMAPPPVVPPPPVAIRLLRVEPEDHGTIGLKRPEISATFAVPVVADSVRITLDERDVTAGAYVSGHSFSFAPAYDLPVGPHDVAVHGRIADGPPFAAHWTFSTDAAVNPNFLGGLEPPSGTPVGRHFAIRGKTLPNSRVTVVATTSVTVDRFSDEAMQGSQTAEVVADGNGFFEAHLDVDDDRGAGFLDVRVRSTAPDGSVAVRTLRLRP
jgi:hypothetical protein